MMPPWDRGKAFAATVVFVIALIDIGWELIRHGSVVGILGYLAGCSGGYLVAANWVEFRWQSRHRADYARLLAPATRTAPPAGGFAARVDQRFDHYLWRNVPDRTDRSHWLTVTKGVRNHLRDEIVEIYREQRVSAEQLNWLIWHEVITMKDHWSQGRFYSPAAEFRATRVARITRASGVTVSAPGVIVAAAALLRADPACGFLALAILAASGYCAAHRWTNIALERRRATAEQAENDRKAAERVAAHEKYLDYLARNMPSDQEMAEWLDCDKKVLLEHALQHYGLKRSDIISHALLEAPGKSYKRARVRKGPWRYTRYRVVVFLLTGVGMRQVSFELNTTDGIFQQLERQGYRYDAIASIQVRVAPDHQQTFDLHLVNGQTISLSVADPDPTTEGHAEETDTESVAKATQDAAGLRNTLRVLEGVSADGKGWIARETQMQDA